MKASTILLSLISVLICTQGLAEVENKIREYRPDGDGFHLRKYDPDYKIMPGDIFYMQILDKPDLGGTYKIEADGTIRLPLIDKIKVGGLTASQTQKYIQASYNADYLVDPKVTLLLIELRERRILVMGQLNKPGPVLIPLGEKLTLTQAIAAAGDFNLRAKRTDIRVTRTDPNGTKKVFYFDFKKILKNIKELDPVLQDGDIVFVN